MRESDDEPGGNRAEFVDNGGFMLYLIVMMIAFWALAVVCEDYFVPALNILCSEYDIPDNVAGATLMASGASSPELFSSIIALFITKSSLGVGTIIGSEIFNHLGICAGSALYSKENYFLLDWRVLSRECFFYALALGILIVALDDTVDIEDDDYSSDHTSKHLDIHWWQALLLIIVYIFYALACWKYQLLQKLFCPLPDALIRQQLSLGDAIGPSYDFEQGDGYKLLSDTDEVLEMIEKEKLQQRERSESYFAHYTMGFLEGLDYMALTHFEETENSLSCWLWKKSRFYSKIRLSSNKWQLKYFTLNHDGLSYCRDPKRPKYNRRFINIWKGCDVRIVDENRGIFKLITPKQKYHFQAPSIEIMIYFIRKIREIIEEYQTLSIAELERRQTTVVDSGMIDDHDDEEVENMLEWPESYIGILIHMILYPVKWAFVHSIPDVRMKEYHHLYTFAIIICVGWLAIWSYIMIFTAEVLGDWIGLSDTVMGLTVSAVGTSFPNLFSSILVAKQGLGNMAVSNAFGSNVFNIGIALGVPWLLYILITEEGGPYKDLKDEGIIVSILILIGCLFFFLILLIFTRMRLYKWMGILFSLMYILFLVYAIGFA